MEDKKLDQDMPEFSKIVFMRECSLCRKDFTESIQIQSICNECQDKKIVEEIPRDIHNYLTNNKNFCLIGPAGCGKSYMIKSISVFLNMNQKLFDILCPTGTSAINVNGVTYHSVFGFRPLGISGLFFNLNINNILTLSDDILLSKLKNPRYRSCYNRIKQLDCIIFDEFSMIQHSHVDCMNRICGLIKECVDKPFGGIQIIFVGDPFQMRPVMGDYPFNSKCWDNLGLEYYELVSTKLPRFCTEEFSDITRMIRLGLISSYILEKFKTQTKDPPNKIIELYYTNKDVNDSNTTEYKNINNKEYEYPSNLSVSYVINDIGVRLSVRDDKLITGECSLDFNDDYNNQYNLIIKEHGTNIKKLVDKNIQEFTKNLTNIYGTDYMLLKFKPETRIISTINCKQEESNEYLYVNGSTGEIMECMEKTVKVKFDNDRTLIIEYKNIEFTRRIKITETLYIDITIKFYHIPLRLGYSFSYNRAQGTTLDTVLISGKSLRKINGIVYVAISRCKTFERMFIKDLPFDKIQVSNLAVEKFRNHYISEIFWLHSRHPDWFNEYYLNTDNEFNSQKVYGIIETIKSGTDILRIIESRGSSQGSIRKWLLETQKCCCITGERIPELLEACHIIPYCEMRRTTEAHNGNTFLLRVDLHKLYDKFLMSISSSGEIYWHPIIKGHQFYSSYSKANIPEFINREYLDKQYTSFLRRLD